MLKRIVSGLSMRRLAERSAVASSPEVVAKCPGRDLQLLHKVASSALTLRKRPVTVNVLKTFLRLEARDAE